MKAQNGYKIMMLDDDRNITDALGSYFAASGYEVDTENDPIRALERMKEKSYHILLLDYLMRPICGDEVVARLRKFDRSIFVILLTGHKEMAPPLQTIRELDIQGYYEKNERFDQLELLVESCVKSIKQMELIRNYQRGLSTILETMPKLHQLLPFEGVLDQIIQHLQVISGGEDVFLLLKPHDLAGDIVMQTVPETVFLGRGGFAPGLEQFWRQSSPGQIEAMQKVFAGGGQIYQNNTHYVPLAGANGKNVGGVLAVRCAAPDNDGLLGNLLSIYAEQAQSALRNTMLHLLVDSQKNALAHALEQIQDSYMQTIETVRLLVDAKDIYTRGHSDRVAYYSKKLAERVSTDPVFIERTRVSGLLHDVGKIGTSDAILCKNGQLTDEEKKEIQKHPQTGAAILGQITMFSELGHLVCSHHERYDGTGYPHRLAGENIPLESRIIAIVDSFDAMMSDRHYRRKFSFEKARQELVAGKNSQFDSSLVDEFLKVLEDFEQSDKELAWTNSAISDGGTQDGKKLSAV